MEPIFPVLPGEFQELTPVLCSEERARTEWGFLIWVSFLSLLLSLGLKFQLCHVKGSGQDLTISIRHLWDTGGQKYVEKGRNREKEEPDKLVNARIKRTPQTRHYSSEKSPVFPQLFYSWDLQAWPKHPGISFVFAVTSSFSHQSAPLLTCLQEQTFQGYLYPRRDLHKFPSAYLLRELTGFKYLVA